MDGMLTLREVMDYLDLEQAGVEKLVKKGRLSAYKVGGAYLRFKKDQVVGIKSDQIKKASRANTFLIKARDYWCFNRVYLFSAVLLTLLVYLFVR